MIKVYYSENDEKHTQPQDHGFDKWLALHAFALPTHKNPNNFFEDGKALGEIEGFSAEIAVNKAIDYITERDKEKPFFLFLPMAEVHSEIASPDEFNAQYSEFTAGEIDGKGLKELLEYSASLTYGLVQFSGLQIDYDFKQPIGERVIKARIKGKKIKENKDYTVACSAFVAGGGDGFSMLKNGKVLAKSDKKFIDFLLDYIIEKKEILLPEIGRQIVRY